MTKEEFFKKYNIHFEDSVHELSFLMALDNLYVQFPKEVVLSIVADYYDNADEIFNDTKTAIMEGIQKLKDLFGSGEFEEANTTNEDFIDKDKLN